MTRRVLACVLASAVWIAAEPSKVGTVAAPEPNGYVCYRAATPVRVDGRLQDAAWRDAPWTTAFVDIEGAARPTPPLLTRAKMLWDDEHFYVAAELEEPQLWATLTRHDSVIFHDADFEVFIDPNGDSHEYYELEINALGTVWDLLLPRPYKDGGRPVDDWEIAGLVSAVALDGTLNDPRDRDRGWAVELAFPWRALGALARRRSPPENGDQWRVNFSRVQWPLQVEGGKYRKTPGSKEDNWVWSPQGVVDMHRPESWGYVQFSTGPPGTAPFESDPSRPARRWLQQVYYAQVGYRREHGRWARSLEELAIAAPAGDTLGEATLEVTTDLYQATVGLRRPGGTVQRWSIRQDALVWVN